MAIPKGQLVTPVAFDAAGLPQALEVDAFGNLKVVGMTHNLLDGSVHPDTLMGGCVMGDLIVGNATPKWSRLAIGAANYIVKSVGGVVVWAAEEVLITDLGSVNTEQRVFHSNLGTIVAANLLVSNVAYFVYVGRTCVAITPKYVELYVTVVGAGAQTAEVGLFSTPSAPNKAAQSLTKIESTDTVNALNATKVKRNTVAFGTVIPAYTHLWAGVRTAMATTQPTVTALLGDLAEGHILECVAAGALTGAGPWAGTIIAASNSVEAANLRVTLD
jgi:hypothetical protein